MTRTCPIYSPCRGVRLPCGWCYTHCQCPAGAHDRYLVHLGEVRVMAAQAAAGARVPPSKRK